MDVALAPAEDTTAELLAAAVEAAALVVATVTVDGAGHWSGGAARAEEPASTSRLKVARSCFENMFHKRNRKQDPASVRSSNSNKVRETNVNGQTNNVTSSLESAVDSKRGSQWLLICRPQGVVEV